MGIYKPKTGLGEVGSWICGKIHESNKCGAVFTDFNQDMKMWRIKTNFENSKMYCQKSMAQAFTTFMKTILLKFKPVRVLPCSSAV